MLLKRVVLNHDVALFGLTSLETPNIVQSGDASLLSSYVSSSAEILATPATDTYITLRGHHRSPAKILSIYIGAT